MIRSYNQPITRRTGARRATAAALVVALFLTLRVQPVAAGCGCQKPPPDAAAIRPNATYSGTPVTLFNSAFKKAGQSYSVDFIASTSTVTVTGALVNRRDLADGVYKLQLVVNVPNLPLGPTGIRVRDSRGTSVMTINDSDFTVVPQPIAMPQDVGSSSYPLYKAAVGRDGTFYISLDMTNITLPRIFRAQAKGYPLTFTSDGVVFYNIQGFHMQLLNASMPGLFSVAPPTTTTDSDILGYSRHEFSTYYLRHQERQPHALDPTDPNWHVDGTRHVDHNHLVLAISGKMQNGTQPVPGSTPYFTLGIQRFSIFNNGLVGGAGGNISGISMSNSARTDSFSSQSGAWGHQGDVLTNATVYVGGSAVIDGNATGTAFNVGSTSQITGAMTVATQPQTFMPLNVPDLLTDLGQIDLTNCQTQTIRTGSYQTRYLNIQNKAILYIDNCAGPVTLYVTGNYYGVAVNLSNQSGITVCDPNPEKFAVYVTTSAPVSLMNQGSFYGVVYAPQSAVGIGNSADFYGAFVGNTLVATGGARVHFDTYLRGQ